MQVVEKQTFNSIKIREEKSFEQVFRAYYPRLCAYAMTIVNDRDEAEEVVQTLFCKLWEQRNELDVTISMQAYLFRATRNACLNHLKKVEIREAYKTMNMEHIDSNPDFQPDRAANSELRRRLERAIAELPEQCRLIFKLSRFEELKYKDIADQLGISVKTVENQMGKALKILRLKMVEFLSLLLILVC